MNRELPMVRFWRDQRGKWRAEVSYKGLVHDGRRFIRTLEGWKEIEPVTPSELLRAFFGDMKI